MPESLFQQSCRPEAWNFIKNETLPQVFSSEFCEISKNTFFTEHPWTTASDMRIDVISILENIAKFHFLMLNEIKRIN